MSLLIVSVDNTILNVALPTLRTELDASSSELQWIVDCYLLVFAVASDRGRRLGDRFGRKKALAVPRAHHLRRPVCAGGDVGGSTELIASRPMGLAPRRSCPRPFRSSRTSSRTTSVPRRSPIWASVAGMGVAIGPISGGWLIEHFDWTTSSSSTCRSWPAPGRGATLIPESLDPGAAEPDFPGAGLSIAGLTALVWGLIEAPERGWTDLAILAAFAYRRGDPGPVHRVAAALRPIRCST